MEDNFHNVQKKSKKCIDGGMKHISKMKDKILLKLNYQQHLKKYYYWAKNNSFFTNNENN